MARGRSTDHAGSRNKGRSRSHSKTRKLKCYHYHKEWHYIKDCPERKWKKKDNSKTADAGVAEDNSDGADVLSITISSSDGGWILDTGCSYHMCPNRDWFATYHSVDGGKVLMGNDVTCKGSTVTGAASAASFSDIDSDTTKLWHMRLGHMSERGMDVLSKQRFLGSKKTEKLDFCEHCVFGKQCMVKFSGVVHNTKGMMQSILTLLVTSIFEIRCIEMNSLENHGMNKAQNGNEEGDNQFANLPPIDDLLANLGNLLEENPREIEGEQLNAFSSINDDNEPEESSWSGDFDSDASPDNKICQIPARDARRAV
ncbi:hypothetical protein RJ640_009208 [Escallonia rubra]|uniref:GAG-pre-integrase domain-containing protein n=1 Tax=Escallonia rubra TaxID=112253 RepID=A0AA88QCX3_9ASTE|nr:hypothetical protein RJ640_009208 [Escallonia rubra]